MLSTPGRLVERPFGFAEWFQVGDRERVCSAIDGMRACGAKWLRTDLSPAAFSASGGADWFDWLIPKLSTSFELLPAIDDRLTASSSAREHETEPQIVDEILARYGRHFGGIEVWGGRARSGTMDLQDGPELNLIGERLRRATEQAGTRSLKVVLGGIAVLDLQWLDALGRGGVLGAVSAIGLQGFPATWDDDAVWQGWDTYLEKAKTISARFNPAAELWISATGYSTWRHDEAAQVERFRAAAIAPATRFYWCRWQDQSIDKTMTDPREASIGAADAQGRPKLLARLLTQGSGTLAPPRPTPTPRARAPVVIIGGAGFIGSNLAASFAADGQDVVVFDSLSRPGVEQNLAWLQRSFPARITARLADIRDQAAVDEVVTGAASVFHFASQVAVTTSLADPMHDFAVNAQGTLHVLEAVRRHAADTPVIFASTNKVYGDLGDVTLGLRDGRHMPVDPILHGFGINESRKLDFCTPYGCSKGAADQYVLDYAKSFGLRTAVLRMSCIYGPRQFGTEDQGWVAHFLIRALRGEPITLYGDGHQVRDILHVSDAIAAYRAVLGAIDAVSGRAFNLGGGPDNAVSLSQVLAEIAAMGMTDTKLLREDWRTGDQLYFVADTRRLSQAVGWNARIGWREGLRDLAGWLSSEHGFSGRPGTAPTRLTA